MVTVEPLVALLSLNITVVYSPAPRQVRQWSLALAAGATVVQALAACRCREAYPELQTGVLKVGIWGRKTSLDHPLQDQDRLEIYRPLKVDPKTARRERFSRQGAKSAGLFARSRPGAKAGY
jgi:putative ubiquitin-RnfH superfamily antitoxin RatB of RatAB toxin-antitoxin module